MISYPKMPSPQEGTTRFQRASRDVVALGIVFAAIIMFVGTGGSALPRVVHSLFNHGVRPDVVMTNALLLNIALLIFGWRRYSEFNAEIARREAAEAQALQLAETDPLTGCLNRRSIVPATNALIVDCAARGEIVAFLMIDLDNFKLINDFNGHIAGDSILRECSNRIIALLPERGLLARIGGDEFACVIPCDADRTERVEQIAQAILDAIAQPILTNGPTVDVTASVGVTRSDHWHRAEGEQVDSLELLHMADVAMYHAKKQGRNRYYWFETPMETELRFRSELEAGIRHGIPRGEFVPFYEQQIDLETGKLVGFEMLARWNSPTMGVVSPDVFIPISEEIGNIAELSESVIAQALIDARDWDPSLTLSVNISPIQLRDPWFAQKILKMLTEANFPPSRLEIEITESCLHENIGVVRSLITSLKNQGIRISLDDFGTGYSSLAQLRSLPFDRIKIDRSFVTNLNESHDSATIVKAITSLGMGLGLPITAEGIETEAVLEELQRLGKFKGQGYLYGRPEPADLTNRKLAELDLLASSGPALPAPAVAVKVEAAPAPAADPDIPENPQPSRRTA